MFPIPLFEKGDSWTSLLRQVPDIAKYIRRTMHQHPDDFKGGYDLLCHSQGAVICRAVVQYMDDHEVHTLISMAGPQMGAWGDHFSSQANVNHMVDISLKADLTPMFYSPMLQRSNSVANLWNDPLRQKDYVEHNEFMAVYNGLTPDAKGNARRKKNFVRLSKAVFFVGDFGNQHHWDGSIEPWQTGIFGYYKNGSTTEFVTMSQTEVYLKDTFGLRTLDEQGKLVLSSPLQVKHDFWINNENVFMQHVLPQLQGK